MRYLAGVIISSIVLFIVACSNSGGTSPVMRNAEVIYRDLHIIAGSDKGPVEVAIDTVKIVEYKFDTIKIVDGKEVQVTEIRHKKVYLDVDSLYATLVINNYFAPIYSDKIKEGSNVTFEFLEDEGDMLRYIWYDSKRKKEMTIISNYKYEGNSLYVLKGGEEPILVAQKDEKTGEFYRTIGLILPQLEVKEGEEEAVQAKFINNSPLDPIDNVIITTEIALDSIGFSDPATFTNPNDRVVWANLKFYYR